jgi:hypothetical protein
VCVCVCSSCQPAITDLGLKWNFQLVSNRFSWSLSFFSTKWAQQQNIQSTETQTNSRTGFDPTTISSRHLNANNSWPDGETIYRNWASILLNIQNGVSLRWQQHDITISWGTFNCFVWAAMAQSVQRLATDWTVRGSNSGGGRDFPHQSRPDLGTTQPPIHWVPGPSRGVNRPGRGVDHPPPPSADVKEWAEPCIYFPPGSSWSVLGRTVLDFTLHSIFSFRNLHSRLQRRGLCASVLVSACGYSKVTTLKFTVLRDFDVEVRKKYQLDANNFNMIFLINVLYMFRT